MRALVCRRTGNAPLLAVEEQPSRPLKAGELRIRVVASGLNRADAMQVSGTHQHAPAPPFTPGFEVAGTVLESTVPKLFTRDANVVAATRFGAHASEVIVEASSVVAAPAGVCPQTAATLPVAYATALLALRHRAALEPGETVLVTGAAGKVGSAAVDVAAKLGARVIALVRDHTQAASVAARAEAVVGDIEELEAAIRDVTARRGVDVVFDTANGPALPPSMAALAPLGRYLVVGVGSGAVRALLSTEVLVRNVALIGVDWDWHLRRDRATAHEVLASLADWWRDDWIAAPAVNPRPLTQGPQVLAELAAGDLPANTVLVP